jgi:hypothetical protein
MHFGSIPPCQDGTTEVITYQLNLDLGLIALYYVKISQDASNPADHYNSVLRAIPEDF